VRIGWLRSLRMSTMRSPCSRSSTNWLPRPAAILLIISWSYWASRGSSIRIPAESRLAIMASRWRTTLGYGPFAARRGDRARSIRLGKKKTLGFAAHRSFLTYVAVVAEVDVNDRDKSGFHVFTWPSTAGRSFIRSREGAVRRSGCVRDQYCHARGDHGIRWRVKQSNFDSYPVARIHESPIETHVHIVASNEPPTGVGEPGVPPMAPAICNAIFAGTGRASASCP